MKKKAAGILLALVMVITALPLSAVTAFAEDSAVSVSGTVNASTLEDGAGLILTGDTVLVMDTARSLAWINCDQAYDADDEDSKTFTHELTIRGAGELTVTGVVCVSRLTVSGAKVTAADTELSSPGEITVTGSELTAYKLASGTSITIAEHSILRITEKIDTAGEVFITDSDVTAEAVNNGSHRTIIRSTVTGAIGGGGDTTIEDSVITTPSLSNAQNITVRNSVIISEGERPSINCGNAVTLEHCTMNGVLYMISCGDRRTITDTDLIMSGAISGGAETIITDSEVSCTQISNGGDVIIRNSSVSTQSEYGITNGSGVEITDSNVTLEGSFSVSEEITFVNSTVDVGGKIANGGDVTLDRSRVVVHGTGCERGVSLPGKLTVGNGSALTAEGSVMAVGATNGITLGDLIRIAEPTGGTIGQTTGEAPAWTIFDAEGAQAARARFSILFRDVTDPSLFYYNSVYWAVDAGITTGFSDGTFRPMNTCNRAAVVTFLWRLAGRPEASTPAQFTDMTGNEDFDRAIAWAAENEITTGYDDGTFRPWNACNRAAIVTFLYRFARLQNGGTMPASGGAAEPFSDMTGNEEFNQAIIWAAENGITTGYADGTFRPWDTCKRLAIVSFLDRFAHLS